MTKLLSTISGARLHTRDFMTKTFNIHLNIQSGRFTIADDDSPLRVTGDVEFENGYGRPESGDFESEYLCVHNVAAYLYEDFLGIAKSKRIEAKLQEIGHEILELCEAE